MLLNEINIGIPRGTAEDMKKQINSRRKKEGKDEDNRDARDILKTWAGARKAGKKK